MAKECNNQNKNKPREDKLELLTKGFQSSQIIIPIPTGILYSYCENEDMSETYLLSNCQMD